MKYCTGAVAVVAMLALASTNASALNSTRLGRVEADARALPTAFSAASAPTRTSPGPQPSSPGTAPAIRPTRSGPALVFANPRKSDTSCGAAAMLNPDC